MSIHYFNSFDADDNNELILRPLIKIQSAIRGWIVFNRYKKARQHQLAAENLRQLKYEKKKQQEMRMRRLSTVPESKIFNKDLEIKEEMKHQKTKNIVKPQKLQTSSKTHSKNTGSRTNNHDIKVQHVQKKSENNFNAIEKLDIQTNDKQEKEPDETIIKSENRNDENINSISDNHRLQKMSADLQREYESVSNDLKDMIANAINASNAVLGATQIIESSENMKHNRKDHKNSQNNEISEDLRKNDKIKEAIDISIASKGKLNESMSKIIKSSEGLNDINDNNKSTNLKEYKPQRPAGNKVKESPGRFQRSLVKGEVMKAKAAQNTIENIHKRFIESTQDDQSSSFLFPPSFPDAKPDYTYHNYNNSTEILNDENYRGPPPVLIKKTVVIRKSAYEAVENIIGNSSTNVSKAIGRRETTATTVLSIDVDDKLEDKPVGDGDRDGSEVRSNEKRRPTIELISPARKYFIDEDDENSELNIDNEYESLFQIQLPNTSTVLSDGGAVGILDSETDDGEVSPRQQQEHVAGKKSKLKKKKLHKKSGPSKSLARLLEMCKDHIESSDYLETVSSPMESERKEGEGFDQDYMSSNRNTEEKSLIMKGNVSNEALLMQHMNNAMKHMARYQSVINTLSELSNDENTLNNNVNNNNSSSISEEVKVGVNVISNDPSRSVVKLAEYINASVAKALLKDEDSDAYTNDMKLFEDFTGGNINNKQIHEGHSFSVPQVDEYQSPRPARFHELSAHMMPTIKYTSHPNNNNSSYKQFYSNSYTGDNEINDNIEDSYDYENSFLNITTTDHDRLKYNNIIPYSKKLPRVVVDPIKQKERESKAEYYEIMRASKLKEKLDRQQQLQEEYLQAQRNKLAVFENNHSAAGKITGSSFGESVAPQRLEPDPAWKSPRPSKKSLKHKSRDRFIREPSRQGQYFFKPKSSALLKEQSSSGLMFIIKTS